MMKKWRAKSAVGALCVKKFKPNKLDSTECACGHIVEVSRVFKVLL